MKIEVTVIPHSEQRYPTLGDWVFGDDTLKIAVSDLGDDNMNFVLALHEMVEAMLCLKHGIPEETVAAFDMAHPELDDPGNDPRAPYREEHRYAEHIETMVAMKLGIRLADYNKRCAEVAET